jgi:multidrug efflux pump
VGVIYQQFSVSMAVSILFSAFLALSLTPALCATLLKPIAKGEHHERKGFFGWFNRRFDGMSNGYQRWVTALARSGRYLLMYAALVGVLVLASPAAQSFLPTEDQGYTITDIQLPPGASRTHHQWRGRSRRTTPKSRASASTTLILGFSFSGSGQNAALAFTTLKDWSERGSDDSASPSPTARPWPSPAQGRHRLLGAAAAGRRPGRVERLRIPPAGPRRHGPGD